MPDERCHADGAGSPGKEAERKDSQMIIRKIQPKVIAAKKRVAAYCRVSTLRDEQNESFETQKRYYEEMIGAHPDWELVKIYSDRHSATAAKNRPGFQELLADAEAKKLDIVICKSVSRFARNIVDCQKYTKWFITLGITVIFEEQNIRTDDPTSGFIFSMMSAIAQNESHSISENVRKSYESRFARGEYNLGNNRILGYDSANRVLIPNKDAWIIKEIFKQFLEGKTYREISDAVVAMGAKTRMGKDHFTVEAIRYILSNEVYVGDRLLQKQPPRDYLTKKPDPNRKFTQNYLSGDHEAIIDRKTWDKVQEILKQRKEANKAGIYRRSKEHHIFYGKVFCGECGAPFVRRTCQGRKGSYKAWNCKERQMGKRGNGCKNRIIKEDELIQMVRKKFGCGTLDREVLNSVSKILVYGDRIEIE